MGLTKFLSYTAIAAVLLAGQASAETIHLAAGGSGKQVDHLRAVLNEYEKASGDTVVLVPLPASSTEQFGQFKLWLAAGNSEIDVYRTDVIWAPQLASHFVDLSDVAKDVVKDFFPSAIAGQTVNGHLVALPFSADAPALYYRKDLLEKYGKPVPQTWSELEATASEIMEKERAAGKADMWGFVFQGNAYEGLTCNALEWVASNGGGNIIEKDGTVSINNEKAAAALDRAAGWVGKISPPGVLAYKEEESRGVWQLGNAVFMRNWLYAYAPGQSADSPIKDHFGAAPLPKGDGAEATSVSSLGGWNLAVSKYSQHAEAAEKLVLFLTKAEQQKKRAIDLTLLPTLTALYDDKDIVAAQPIIARWKDVFLAGVPRPAAVTKLKYNEASSLFWSAVHDTLAKTGTAAENLDKLEVKLADLEGGSW